jgi:hypothetical protein
LTPLTRHAIPPHTWTRTCHMSFAWNYSKKKERNIQRNLWSIRNTRSIPVLRRIEHNSSEFMEQNNQTGQWTVAGHGVCMLLRSYRDLRGVERERDELSACGRAEITYKSLWSVRSWSAMFDFVQPLDPM